MSTEREALTEDQLAGMLYTAYWPQDVQPFEDLTLASRCRWIKVARTARAALQRDTQAKPSAYRVWVRGETRRYSRGLFEATGFDRTKWEADGDEVEPLYASAASTDTGEPPWA
jgi:hypothetical protein